MQFIALRIPRDTLDPIEIDDVGTMTPNNMG
jgi:hypothetical protein